MTKYRKKDLINRKVSLREQYRKMCKHINFRSNPHELCMINKGNHNYNLVNYVEHTLLENTPTNCCNSSVKCPYMQKFDKAKQFIQ